MKPGNKLPKPKNDINPIQLKGDFEIGYIAGRQEAYTTILGQCFRALGIEGKTFSSLVEERAKAINKLRSICNNGGNLSWSDENDLSDIIEKSLLQYLGKERVLVKNQLDPKMNGIRYIDKKFSHDNIDAPA